MTGKYNNKGELIFYTQQFSSGSVHNSAIEFVKLDERENWIELTLFTNGIPSSYHIREIEYY